MFYVLSQCIHCVRFKRILHLQADFLRCVYIFSCFRVSYAGTGWLFKPALRATYEDRPHQQWAPAHISK